jgi:hypothetical protein
MFRAWIKLIVFGTTLQSAILATHLVLAAETDEDSRNQALDTTSGFVLLRYDVDQVFVDDQSLLYEIHAPKRGTNDPQSKAIHVDNVNAIYDSADAPKGMGIAAVSAVSANQRPNCVEPIFSLNEPPAFKSQAQCDPCNPVLSGIVEQNCPYDVSNWSPIARWFGLGRDHGIDCCSDVGVGQERVVFAPFEIDFSQPTNYTLVRWDSGFGLQTPDRGEYFYSKPGTGPKVSHNSIQFQDFRFITEAGSDVFSLQTEIPVRFLEPNNGDSTSGLGDMKVATKARLINGDRWQITQIFRTYINTGSASKGVGTGHLSLEPGLLTRYKIRPDTYVHGEVKFLVPIAADQGFVSNVLTYGVGVSHVLYESNNFAIIPDFEFVAYNFSGGQKTVTDPNTGVGFAVNASGDNAYNVVTGTRFVIGPKGDLGLNSASVTPSASELADMSMIYCDLNFASVISGIGTSVVGPTSRRNSLSISATGQINLIGRDVRSLWNRYRGPRESMYWCCCQTDDHALWRRSFQAHS